MDTLASLLGRERLLLELLTFKLVELRQLLAAGETRFLDWAADEVDRALTGMRGVELERAVILSSTLTESGLDDDASLRELIALAEEPWSTILGEHRDTMVELTAEVEEELAACRHLARSGVGAVAETLERMSAGACPSEPELRTHRDRAPCDEAAPPPRVGRRPWPPWCRSA